jgi:hypothetical protein
MSGEPFEPLEPPEQTSCLRLQHPPGTLVRMRINTLVLTAEAAALLHVTPAAVRLMETRGDLPAMRTPSGVRLFDKAAVERLAQRRAQHRVNRAA